MSMSYSFSVDDPELIEMLESADSKSGLVRSALRNVSDGHSWPDELTQEQGEALGWMLDRTGGGGVIRLETVKNRVARELSISKEAVVDDVIRPLSAKEYVTVKTNIQSVLIEISPMVTDES